MRDLPAGLLLLSVRWISQRKLGNVGGMLGTRSPLSNGSDGNIGGMAAATRGSCCRADGQEERESTEPTRCGRATDGLPVFLSLSIVVINVDNSGV